MSDTSSLRAVMETDKGTIHLDLFPEQAPVTVASFVNLANRGFYDGLSCHRVIADFMIQGGCPLGTGTGDPGYRFEDECTPELRHDRPGVLSMANAGPRTNGSQFFITHVHTPWLDGKHTVFGRVVASEDQEPWAVPWDRPTSADDPDVLDDCQRRGYGGLLGREP